MRKNYLLLCFFTTLLALNSCKLFLNSNNTPATSKEKLITEDFTYNQTNAQNPLKGFMNWYEGSNSKNFPSSLVYIPLYVKNLLPAENTVDFESLESALTYSAQHKQQAVIRIIAEEPGAERLPQHIINKMTRISYTIEDDPNTYYSPDYDNEYFKNQIFYLLSEMGNQYNDDPRIAFIQSGIYGHWGEMHTYYVEQTYKNSTNKHKTSKDTIVSIVQAVNNAFPSKSVGVRTPKDMPSTLTNHGYYNDMFYADNDDNYMSELLQIADTENRWKTQAITGEFAPPLQDEFLGVSIPSANFDKFISKLNYFHPTTLLFTHAFGNPNSVSYNKSTLLKAASMMGYDFYITNASLTDNILTVTIKNMGTAPFYYDWPVKIALYDGQKIVCQVTANWKISEIPSKNDKTFSQKLDYNMNNASSYSVLLSIPNPMENGYPIRFSNISQDSVLDGWITLGEIE